MEKSQKVALHILLSLVYFPIVAIDLYGEYVANNTVVFVVKPLITVVASVIYYSKSENRDSILTISLLLALVSSILFIPGNATTLLWGISVFSIHRLFLIIFLLKLLKTNDYLPILIGSLPVLVIFFYLISITTDIANLSLVVFSLNNILIAFFFGIIIADYMLKEDNNNIYLLISALMFLALQLIVYIEKFYLLEMSPKILRPTAVLFYAIALFTLIKAVLFQERLNRDTSA